MIFEDALLVYSKMAGVLTSLGSCTARNAAHARDWIFKIYAVRYSFM